VAARRGAVGADGGARREACERREKRRLGAEWVAGEARKLRMRGIAAELTMGDEFGVLEWGKKRRKQQQWRQKGKRKGLGFRGRRFGLKKRGRASARRAAGGALASARQRAHDAMALPPLPPNRRASRCEEGGGRH
jgi:hypothetical protein